MTEEIVLTIVKEIDMQKSSAMNNVLKDAFLVFIPQLTFMYNLLFVTTVQPAYKDAVYKDFPFIRLLGPKYFFTISCLYFPGYYSPVNKAIPLIRRLILVTNMHICPLITLTMGYSVK